MYFDFFLNSISFTTTCIKFSFENGRKLRVIIYDGDTDEIRYQQPNSVDFSNAIVSTFDLSVCANTLDLKSGYINLNLISSNMQILPLFTEYNIPDRPNSDMQFTELKAFLLQRRLAKVNLISFIFLKQ